MKMAVATIITTANILVTKTSNLIAHLTIYQTNFRRCLPEE